MFRLFVAGIFIATYADIRTARFVGEMYKYTGWVFIENIFTGEVTIIVD